jgi:hypothetical protein
LGDDILPIHDADSAPYGYNGPGYVEF